MPLSLYQASVPVYLKLLGGLGVMIDKAVSAAEAQKYPPGNVFAARLFPDMWSFSEQVRATTTHAFRGTARLAGLSIPEIADNGRFCGQAGFSRRGLARGPGDYPHGRARERSGRHR